LTRTRKTVRVVKGNATAKTTSRAGTAGAWAMCEGHNPLKPRLGEEYVRWTQELRRSSVARPHGSLRRRNRQNKRRAAIERSKQES
jgi:hypothetical protein